MTFQNINISSWDNLYIKYYSETWWLARLRTVSLEFVTRQNQFQITTGHIQPLMQWHKTFFPVSKAAEAWISYVQE
jgi:hypothetical protein